MADRLPEIDTSRIATPAIAQEIENMKMLANNQRKNFARGWYDNDFFDDGHHFRFISRSTGRIVDTSEKATIYSPRRAIPKASRQIRGMANLLLSQDFQPLVLPEKVTIAGNECDSELCFTDVGAGVAVATGLLFAHCPAN